MVKKNVKAVEVATQRKTAKGS